MAEAEISFRLPAWLGEYEETERTLATREDRMRLAVELSRRNIEEGMGGPFGALVVERESGRLLSVGVNRVIETHCSAAHAEMIALMRAQQKQASYNLAAPGLPPCELVTTAEPCAMCFGAIPWSGVKAVVSGATREDVEAVGFDEGPRREPWAEALQARGIDVVQEVLREEAAAVLRDYQARGGVIYNGG